MLISRCTSRAQLLLPKAEATAGTATAVPLRLFQPLPSIVNSCHAGGRPAPTGWRSLSLVISRVGELLVVVHSALGLAAHRPRSLGFAVAGQTRWRLLEPGEAASRFNTQPPSARILYGCSITGLAASQTLIQGGGTVYESDVELGCCGNVQVSNGHEANEVEDDDDIDDEYEGGNGANQEEENWSFVGKELVLLLRSREDLDLLRVSLSPWLSPADAAIAAAAMATAAPTSFRTTRKSTEFAVSMAADEQECHGSPKISFKCCFCTSRHDQDDVRAKRSLSKRVQQPQQQPLSSPVLLQPLHNLKSATEAAATVHSSQTTYKKISLNSVTPEHEGFAANTQASNSAAPVFVPPVDAVEETLQGAWLLGARQVTPAAKAQAEGIAGQMVEIAGSNAESCCSSNGASQ